MRTNFHFFTKRTGLLLLILITTLLHSFAQGFSPATEAKLQQVIDSFQNDAGNPYVGGISVAIKVDGLHSGKAPPALPHATLTRIITCCLVVLLLLPTRFPVSTVLPKRLRPH